MFNSELLTSGRLGRLVLQSHPGREVTIIVAYGAVAARAAGDAVIDRPALVVV